MDQVNINVMRVGGNQDLDLPAYGSDGASGMDLRAAVEDQVILAPGKFQLIPTGLAVCIPPGYEAQIRPRSGLALKHGIGMVNSPGTIDSDYRGEIGVILVNWGDRPFTVNRGDRIAQMVIVKVYRAALAEVTDLGDSERGEGGFGHTGIR